MEKKDWSVCDVQHQNATYDKYLTTQAKLLTILMK